MTKIYCSVEDIEQQLQETADKLDEYQNNDDFVAGYDTASDVITCANNATIWHKTDEKPEEISNVLIALEDTGEMIIGWYGYGSWHTTYYYGVIEEERILGWAMMPEWPDEINGNGEADE